MPKSNNLLRDLSEVFADDPDGHSFLGDRIWWENFDDINLQRLHDEDSREYQNVKRMAFEMFMYFISFLFFVALSYTVLSDASSRTLIASHQSFWGMQNVSRMSSGSDFWDWTRNTLAMKALMGTTGEDLVNVTSSLSGAFSANNFTFSIGTEVISGTDMLLMGRIRLRQLRVSVKDCSTNLQYAQVSTFCQKDYGLSSKDMDPFYQFEYPLYLESAFSYDAHVSTSTMIGPESSLVYGSNGYLFDLPPDYNQTVRILEDLEASNWIDPQTSAVIAEVNSYHPSQDTFVVDRFLFEFTSIGSISVSSDSTVFPGGLVVFQPAPGLFILDFFNLILIGVFLKYVLGQIKSQGRRYWRWVFSYLDLTMGIVLVGYIVCRVLLYVFMSDTVLGGNKSVFPDPWIFWPFSSLVTLHSVVIVLQGTVVVLAMLRVFKFFHLSNHMSVFMLQGDDLWTLSSLIIVLSIITIGFGFGYSVVAGYVYAEYSSISSSLLTTLSSLINVMRIEPSWIEHPNLASGISLFFLLIVYVILVPMIISVAANSAWTKSTIPGNNQNAILVFARMMYHKYYAKDDDGELRSNARKTIDASQKMGIDIGELPGVIRKRIVQRRQNLQKRIERELGYVNDSFNEFSDFVSKQELQRLMDENSFLCKVLRTGDVDIVISRYSRDPKFIGSKGSYEINADIEEISKELTTMIQSTRSKVSMDLAELKERVTKLTSIAETPASKPKP